MKGQEHEKFWRTLLGENKKESNVSWQQESPFKKGSGTNQEKCGNRLRSPHDASCPLRNESMVIGMMKRKICRKESFVSELLKEFAKLVRKWQRMILVVWASHRRS